MNISLHVLLQICFKTGHQFSSCFIFKLCFFCVYSYMHHLQLETISSVFMDFQGTPQHLLFHEYTQNANFTVSYSYYVLLPPEFPFDFSFLSTLKHIFTFPLCPLSNFSILPELSSVKLFMFRTSRPLNSLLHA